MGCDIHLAVEVKKDGKWVAVKGTNPLSRHFKDEPKTSFFWLDVDRNYSLFAILADVRNGVGFAGCDLGDGFVPIAMPRGLPKDVSPQLRKESDDWGPDGHSHSHFTVAELMAYDWTQVTNRRGVIHGHEYAEWSRWRKEQGEGPQSYAGDISGPNLKRISAADMEEALAKIKAGLGKSWNWQQVQAIADEQLKNYVCQVQWREAYYQCASDFLGVKLPRLWRLGKPEDVRIVFWFDN